VPPSPSNKIFWLRKNCSTYIYFYLKCPKIRILWMNSLLNEQIGKNTLGESPCIMYISIIYTPFNHIIILYTHSNIGRYSSVGTQQTATRHYNVQNCSMAAALKKGNICTQGHKGCWIWRETETGTLVYCSTMKYACF